MSKSILNRMIHWIKQFIEDPEYKIAQLALRFIEPDKLPDRLSVKYQFHYAFGYALDLKHPKTFNEKLNWMKLYDRNPLYTTLVDKYAVKKWVAERIGERYIIPTLWVYDSVDEINLDELPNQFVLKCTHDSGSVVICPDKSNFNLENAKRILQKGLETNFYLKHREWPYKNVPHRIIAEEYLEDLGISSIPDYKFFCFDGEPKFMFVATERSNPNEETKFDFFDMDFNHINCTNGHPNASVMPIKPKHFEEMKQRARELSKGIKHVRVDLYEVDDKVYFGELTLCHWGEFMKFNPKDFDKNIGEYILIDSKNTLRTGGGVVDYKFFCFNGVPQIMYISCDRSEHPTTDFFDMDFNRLPIRMKDSNSKIPPSRPYQFEEMKSIAKILSKDIPQVRVDFYIVNGQVKFGEMTFFHNGGFTAIKPIDWNIKVGTWIELPKK